MISLIATFYHDYRCILFSIIIPVVAVLLMGHYLVWGAKGRHITVFSRKVKRFTVGERIHHFIRLLSFLIVAGTGLRFVYAETVKGALRAHGAGGIVFVVLTVVIIFIWFRDVIFKDYDKLWLIKLGGYFGKNKDCLPAGRFNAGQKIFFWLTGIIALLLGLTGILLFAGAHVEVSWYSIVLAIHGWLALLLIAAVIGHVYLAVFTNPGTWRVLVDGKVSEEWAHFHHPNWKYLKKP